MYIATLNMRPIINRMKVRVMPKLDGVSRHWSEFRQQSQRLSKSLISFAMLIKILRKTYVNQTFKDT